MANIQIDKYILKCCHVGDLSGHLCYLVARLLQELRRKGGGVAKGALELLSGVAGVK